MDEFLSDIYFSVFKQWIKYQFQGHFTVAGDNIIVEEPSCTIRMGFNELNIIEFEITDKKKDEVVFYLHFQMQNMHHAVNLFEQMMTAVRSIDHEKHYRILLSCSGGLTTSYFAEMLNQAAETLNKDYHFDAVAYSDLLNSGEDYDLIMLAPQISYQRAKLQAVFKEQRIISIPAAIFAKYDTAGAIALVESELERKRDKKSQAHISINGRLENKKVILAISCVRHRHNCILEYQLYDHNKPADTKDHQRIIKKNIYLSDFYDIFDTVFSRYPQVENVGVALPGMVDCDGLVTGSFHTIGQINYQSVFKKRYPAKNFYVYNDCNAGVVGLSVMHPKYRDVALYILGNHNSVGGIGFVINHQLLLGKQGIAGELRWWKMNQDRENKNYIEKAKTVDGTVEIVAENLLPAICMVGPELFGIASDLVPYVQEVDDLLKKHIPEKYMPKLIKVDQLNLYMMIGVVQLINED